MSLVKATKIRAVEETPEKKAAREAEAEAWKRKQEEDIRLAVPRTIEKLRKEATDKLAEAERLATLLGEFPNLRRYVGRWEKVAYYTSEVNGRVDQFDRRFNCGCCGDSPLEVWPYLETSSGRIHSDPPMFTVGEKTSHGARAYDGWDERLRSAGISEGIVESIRAYFERCAEEDDADDLDL